MEIKKQSGMKKLKELFASVCCRCSDRTVLQKRHHITQLWVLADGDRITPLTGSSHGTTAPSRTGIILSSPHALLQGHSRWQVNWKDIGHFAAVGQSAGRPATLVLMWTLLDRKHSSERPFRMHLRATKFGHGDFQCTKPLWPSLVFLHFSCNVWSKRCTFAISWQTCWRWPWHYFMLLRLRRGCCLRSIKVVVNKVSMNCKKTALKKANTISLFRSFSTWGLKGHTCTHAHAHKGMLKT